MCSLRAMRRAIGRRNTGSFSNSTSAGMSPLIKLVEILLAVSLDRLDQRGICPLIELVEILRAAGFDTRDSLALVGVLNQRGFESAD